MLPKHTIYSIAIIYLASVLIMLSGCSPATNELWIHGDGSGRFEQTWDITSYIDFIKAQELSGEEAESEEKSIEILKQFTQGQSDIDTSFSFATIVKRRGLVGLDTLLLEKVIFVERTLIEKFTINYIIQFDFKNPDEFIRIQDECLKLLNQIYIP